MNRRTQLLSRYAVIVIAVLNFTISNAQKFGGKVGTTSTYFTGDPKRLEAGGPGLQVGGFANFTLFGNLAATAGIDYCQLQGVLHFKPTVFQSTDGAETIRTKSSNLTIHMVDVNANVSYAIPLWEEITTRVFAGGSLGYNAGMWGNSTTRYFSDNALLEMKGRENVGSLRTTDWVTSIVAGVRFEVPIESSLFKSIQFEFSTKHAVHSVMHTPERDGRDLRLSSGSLLLGFTF